jgi:hypothetical protein
MSLRWIGARVHCIGMQEAGVWVVVGRAGGWLTLSPQDSAARILANLSPCGTVDIRQQDLKRIPSQEEELPWNS